MNFIFDLEFFGTLFGIISVFFLIKENKLAWYFGIINVSMFIYIFYEKKIFGQFVLQIFFLVLQFYGLYVWGKKNSDVKIKWLNFKQKVYSLLFVFISFFILEPILYFNSDKTILTKLDVFLASLSFLAQSIQAKKKIDNWLIWILVDILSIYLFYQNELYKVMFFYLVLFILATIGFFTWRKKCL